MDEHAIMEVDTPILSIYGNPDPNIDSLITEVHPPDCQDSQLCYLHTSPEFPMKRLLCADSGPIYQICHVFRDTEIGTRHQPEFTMLEWYRPGYDHHRLMDEVEELLLTLGLGQTERRSYGEVFREYYDLNPHRASTGELAHLAKQEGLQSDNLEQAQLLDYLFSHRLAPRLGNKTPIFIYDFPVCQAALAKITSGTEPVAQRFELFINCIEIANGYNELNDYNEQKSRFEQENRNRQKLGKTAVEPDKSLLEAMVHGLPDCAGVAVGVDRLLMVMTGIDNIYDVMGFPVGKT